MTTLFFSYSHKDETFRDQLETHLAMLKRQGLIETWHDRRIVAGDDFAGRISEELEKADVILLLASPDFIASAYCYDIEMARALERHAAGTARVIPVILRRCEWERTPFGKLRATPPDGKAVSTFADSDEAYLEITKDIRVAVEQMSPAARAAPRAIRPDAPRVVSAPAMPRSSNLALKKSFSDADFDRFREESFAFMAKFFEGSLVELQNRNPGIETSFRQVDANRFVARAYVNGKATASCQIAIGTSFGKTITYAGSEEMSGVNEMLSVEADDQALHLKGMGMPMAGGGNVGHLSQEGAAEYYWGLFMKRIQSAR